MCPRNSAQGVAQPYQLPGPCDCSLCTGDPALPAEVGPFPLLLHPLGDRHRRSSAGALAGARASALTPGRYWEGFVCFCGILISCTNFASRTCVRPSQVPKLTEHVSTFQARFVSLAITGVPDGSGSHSAKSRCELSWAGGLFLTRLSLPPHTGPWDSSTSWTGSHGGPTQVEVSRLSAHSDPPREEGSRSRKAWVVLFLNQAAPGLES